MKFSLLVFVTVDELLEMHERALADHGGLAGLRDRGLLEAAAAAPQQTAFGQPAYPSMARMAASLAFSLAKNHAFVDGNKRVAHLASFAFLEYNGLDVLVPPEWAEVIEAVASGQCARDELVKRFASVIVGGDARRSARASPKTIRASFVQAGHRTIQPWSLCMLALHPPGRRLHAA